MIDLGSAVINLGTARRQVVAEWLEDNCLLTHLNRIPYSYNISCDTFVPRDWDSEPQYGGSLRKMGRALITQAYDCSEDETTRRFITISDVELTTLYHQRCQKLLKMEPLADKPLSFLQALASQQVRADKLLQVLKVEGANISQVRIFHPFSGGFKLEVDDKACTWELFMQFFANA